jgi:hypothetical protein
MDMTVAYMTITAAILTQVIGIGNLELLARAPVVNMHPHTAPTSHV